MSFTAKEAKALAGPTLQEKVDSVLESIKVAAGKKKRQLRTGWEHDEDDELWISGGYSKTEDWKNAKKMLEDLGYTVEFYYQEHSIAVDMYTLIKW